MNSVTDDIGLHVACCMLHDSIVTPSQEPAGVALHPIIPALCVPILSTPPFLSVLPLSSSSSPQRYQRKTATVWLSLFHNHTTWAM